MVSNINRKLADCADGVHSYLWYQTSMFAIYQIPEDQLEVSALGFVFTGRSSFAKFLLDRGQAVQASD